MKVSKPILMYLPMLMVDKLNICLIENKPSFSFKTIYFHYLLHYIIEKKLISNKYSFIAINKTKLQLLTVSNIDRYINYLKKYEFIISDKKYKNGEKSLWYKPNELLIDGVVETEIPINSKLYLNIKEQRIKRDTNQSRNEPFLYSMYKHFKNLEYDFEGAKNWVYQNADEDKASYYLTSLNQLQDINFRRFQRNKTNNRLDTNLTNLKKELRQFIEGENINIDLNNSHPYIISILLNNTLNNNNHNTLCSYFNNKNLLQIFGRKQFNDISEIRKNCTKKDFDSFLMFCDATKSGTFYELFINEYGNGITRNDVKDIMFKVLFSKNVVYKDYKKIIPYNKEKQIFKSVFPLVYNVIEILKRNDNAKLPNYLTKIESYIFIDCTAKELVRNNIIPLTIHDSFIVEKQHEAQTLEITKEVFAKQIGIIPTFKIDKI